MWTRAELKEKAKVAVKQSYWGLVLICLIMSFVSGGGGGGSFSNVSKNMKDTGVEAGDTSQVNSLRILQAITGNNTQLDIDMDEFALIMGTVAAIAIVVTIAAVLLAIFVFQPLQVGVYRYMEEACYEQRTVADIGLVGFAFRKGNYLNVVKTMFLMNLYVFFWSLLCVIPGIIKSYEYKMIPYILAENPTIDSKKAFALSKEMMTGNKMDTFVLELSFILWILLAIVTCGLAAIFYVNPYMYMTEAYLYDTLKQNASYDYFDRTLGAGPQYAYAGGYNGGYDAGYNAGGYDTGYDNGGYDAGTGYDNDNYGGYDSGSDDQT